MIEGASGGLGRGGERARDVQAAGADAEEPSERHCTGKARGWGAGVRHFSRLAIS